jgi:hypothetical protein
MAEEVNATSDEQQPLLRDSSQADNGTIERQSADDDAVEEEPSTLRLILVLGTVWVGVFLAALGMSSFRTDLLFG